MREKRVLLLHRINHRLSLGLDMGTQQIPASTTGKQAYDTEDESKHGSSSFVDGAATEPSVIVVASEYGALVHWRKALKAGVA